MKMKKQKAKLMVVTPYFYPKIGGMENYAYNIAKGLKKQFGYEIVVVTSNHEEKKYKEEVLAGMKIYRLPIQFKVSNTPISFKWKKDIKEIIEKEKPNIINAHTPVPFISDVTARVCGDVPFVLTYHNDLVKGNLLLNLVCKEYYLFMGNKTLNKSAKIIATSEYYSHNSPHLKKRLEKIKIVSPGVNLPKNNIFRKNKNQIIFVSQLDKTHTHKGLNYLIESIQEVKKNIKNIKLIVIGSGDNLEEYTQQVKLFHLENNVKFLGRISNEELSKEYSKSEISVLPSYSSSEGFGMVLIEGMAHKCVAIGSRVGGIPCAISENKDGLLVSPKDSNALANAIIKILKDKKLAKKMGEAGYKKVKENFTWDKKAKEMNGIIKGVLRG
ncbi:glycosyltransferase family 4 protein [Patescibacteria group bacterium]|nr:glycosyltransferase family 4 protein [Patescibacteria group bacterium]